MRKQSAGGPTRTYDPWTRTLCARQTPERILQVVAKRVSGFVHSLTNPPATAVQAWSCCAESLPGTADWEQWNIRERVAQSREFRDLGAGSFRTTAARQLRDAWYQKRGIAFLHQASRYRGKANYRDAIYLAYGKSVPRLLESFIDNLAQVLSAFSAMATAYASIRMGRELWLAFRDDLEAKRSISLSPMAV
jgi:hypothetical protein